jgi:hypothetical protein
VALTGPLSPSPSPLVCTAMPTLSVISVSFSTYGTSSPSLYHLLLCEYGTAYAHFTRVQQCLQCSYGSAICLINHLSVCTLCFSLYGCGKAPLTGPLSPSPSPLVCTAMPTLSVISVSFATYGTSSPSLYHLLLCE